MLSGFIRSILRKMIEFCTVRRMIVVLFILGIISMLIMVTENKLSSSVPEHKDATLKTTIGEKKAKNDKCWENENFTTMVDCAPCKSLQMQLNVSFCKETGYYSKVRCEKSRTEAFMSCTQVGKLEARDFWIFESVTFVVGLVSYGVVFYRQRMLDQQLADRINKQIAAGV